MTILPNDIETIKLEDIHNISVLLSKAAEKEEEAKRGTGEVKPPPPPPERKVQPVVVEEKPVEKPPQTDDAIQQMMNQAKICQPEEVKEEKKESSEPATSFRRKYRAKDGPNRPPAKVQNAPVEEPAPKLEPVEVYDEDNDFPFDDGWKCILL
jgi:hypothetical protein